MEKIYCGSGKVVKTKYGNMFKGSMHIDHVKLLLKHMEDNNLEWINWDAKQKREPEQGKPPYYLEVDQWKPDREVEPRPNEVAEGDKDGETLPF